MQQTEWAELSPMRPPDANFVARRMSARANLRDPAGVSRTGTRRIVMLPIPNPLHPAIVHFPIALAMLSSVFGR